MEENNNIQENSESQKKSTAVVYNIALTLVCIALGVIIAVQYRSLSVSGRATADAEKIAMYQTNILTLEQELDTLETENKELSEKVELLENATNEEQIQKLSEELNNIKKFSGVTQAEGAGLYISVSLKGDMLSGTWERHLLSLVNALKASSAQAISINGERITAMSEIESTQAGVVVINGRQSSAPIEIYAIGNPDQLYSGVYLSGGGPLANLDKEKACEVYWETRDNIVLEGCNINDIKTDLLKNAE